MEYQGHTGPYERRRNTCFVCKEPFWTFGNRRLCYKKSCFWWLQKKREKDELKRQAAATIRKIREGDIGHAES